MTYNQLKELDSRVPTPMEYNPSEEQEHVPDMSHKVQGRVDELHAKLMAVRAKVRDKE